MFNLIQLHSKKFTSHSIFFHLVPVELHASHSVGTVVTDTMYCQRVPVWSWDQAHSRLWDVEVRALQLDSDGSDLILGSGTFLFIAPRKAFVL